MKKRFITNVYQTDTKQRKKPRQIKPMLRNRYVHLNVNGIGILMYIAQINIQGDKNSRIV